MADKKPNIAAALNAAFNKPNIAAALNAAFKKISDYINSDPDPLVRNARKRAAFPALYGNWQATLEYAERLPSVEKVNYNGADWKRGFADGRAGRTFKADHLKGSQPYIDYEEGWLMGDAEKGYQGG